MDNADSADLRVWCSPHHYTAGGNFHISDPKGLNVTITFTFVKVVRIWALSFSLQVKQYVEEGYVV